jgi:hypothetical protein
MHIVGPDKNLEYERKVLRSRVSDHDDWHPSDIKKGWVIARLLIAGRPLRFEALLAQCQGVLTKVTLRKALDDLLRQQAVTEVAEPGRKRPAYAPNRNHPRVKKMRAKAQDALDFERSRLKGLEKTVHEVSRYLTRAKRLSSGNRKTAIAAITHTTIGAFAQAFAFELFTDAMARARSRHEGDQLTEDFFRQHIQKIAEVGREAIAKACETDFKIAHAAFIEWATALTRQTLEQDAAVEKILAQD